jgi:hypothetical protein
MAWRVATFGRVSRRAINLSLIAIWIVVMAVVFLRPTDAPPQPVQAAAALPVVPAPAQSTAPDGRSIKIFRMDGPLEKLRDIPRLTNMRRDDDAAYLVLPSGLVIAGVPLPRDEVIEGYVNEEKDRWFVIVQPGDHAFSVMTVLETKPAT